MNLDGITLHSITTELTAILHGGQISKIYQLNGRGLYFRIFNDSGLHHLVITLDDSPRLYVSPVMPPTPDVPTGLCMFLRKYYENGRIASIRQLHLDRLIEIAVDVLDVSGKLATRKIHIELMGKYSNVIFTEDGIILEALIKTRKDKQALRTISPKEPYGFPPNFMRMNPFEFTAQEIAEMLRSTAADETLGTWMLRRFNGMSTVVLNELSLLSGIAKDASVKSLTATELTCWCRHIAALGQELRDVRGAYVYTDGKKEVLFPLPLQSFAAKPVRHYASIQTYLSEYQAEHGSLSGEQERLRKKVAKIIEKQEKKIKRIFQELKETAKMDTYKLYGDLLMIYAYEKHAHENNVTLINLLSETQEAVTIPLNAALSMTDNANHYYKRYTKLRNRKQKSTELQRDNQRQLDYFRSLEYSLETAVTKDELADIRAEMQQMNLLRTNAKEKLKKEFAQKIRTVSADGMEIWIGGNNRQNDFLTTKKAHPYDRWFHVKGQAGSHVILACHKGEPTNAQLEKAAQLAAYYSQSRRDTKVEVDSTLVRHVKKPAHAAPGYVIFENQTTYVVEPKNWPVDT